MNEREREKKRIFVCPLLYRIYIRMYAYVCMSIFVPDGDRHK